MKQLTLLRHAKSSWADADQKDYDRPLNARGLRDAPMMAQRLVEQQCTPDLILCSSAHRTRQTAQFILDVHKLDSNAIDYHDALYLASPGTLLEHVQQCESDINHLMIIAHNPGLESLGRQLHHAALSQMPTCAVLSFTLSSNSFVIQPDTEIDLVLHDYPKNIPL